MQVTNQRQRKTSIHHSKNKQLLAQQQHFLKQLSLSFYPQYIANNHKKQVILDSCPFDSSFQTNTFIPFKYLANKHQKLTANSHKKIVDGSLKIDNYFNQEKVDYIDLITTNASHVDNDAFQVKKGGKSCSRKIRAVSTKCRGRRDQPKQQAKTDRGCAKSSMKRKGKSCISISKKH